MIETYKCRTAQAVDDDGVTKKNLHFDNQSKQVDFHFCVAVISKRNRKYVLCVSIEIEKH